VYLVNGATDSRDGHSLFLRLQTSHARLCFILELFFCAADVGPSPARVACGLSEPESSSLEDIVVEVVGTAQTAPAPKVLSCSPHLVLEIS
jgi:hypothetical protein